MSYATIEQAEIRLIASNVLTVNLFCWYHYRW